MSLTKDMIFSIGRHALTFFAGALVTSGLVDADMAEQAVGAVMTIAALVWSAFQKKKLAP